MTDRVTETLAPGGAAASASGPGLADATDAPVLIGRGIFVRYGGVHAVNDVAIEAYRGQILGLIGPNGAGKSSLLGALGGQLKSQGEITFDGRNVTGAPPYLRAKLGITRTFQTTSEFEGMTVFENLITAARGATGASLAHTVFGWRANRVEEEAAREQAWEVLDRFEMADTANAYGRELSGGQRRLVEIMRCLMRRPKLLLLDEPMVGVAPHLVAKLVGDLRTIAGDGIGLVIVEHALEVVRELCDRVVVMAQGAVIAQGSYASVVENEEVRRAYLG